MGKNKKKKKQVNNRQKPSYNTASNVKKIDDVTIEVIQDKDGRLHDSESGQFEEKYRAEYCKQLVDHMAQGFGFGSFGAEIDVGRQTLYDWCEQYPEFKKARERGKAKRQMFFEKVTRASLMGNKDVNSTLAMFFLKTGFSDDYGDVVKHKHIDAVTAKIEEESENSNQVLVQLAYKV